MVHRRNYLEHTENLSSLCPIPCHKMLPGPTYISGKKICLEHIFDEFSSRRMTTTRYESWVRDVGVIEALKTRYHQNFVVWGYNMDPNSSFCFDRHHIFCIQTYLYVFVEHDLFACFEYYVSCSFLPICVMLLPPFEAMLRS